MWEPRVEECADFRLRVFAPHDAGPSNRDLRVRWLCTYEHIIPRSAGVRNYTREGDVATCGECNSARSSHDYMRFRDLVRAGHTRKAAARILLDETP